MRRFLYREGPPPVHHLYAINHTDNYPRREIREIQLASNDLIKLG